MEKSGLTEFAHRHGPAGDPMGGAGFVVAFRCQSTALRQDIGDGCGCLEGVAEQLDAGLGQGIGLFSPLL